MSINAIILFALKGCQTLEQRFLNRKCVLKQSDATASKIDIEAAVSFFVTAIPLNSCSRAMRYRFFFLLETPF